MASVAARAVLLYGQSLLLSLVAASLKASPELHLVQAATWAEVCASLAKGVPDVLIFQLDDNSESRILPLLLRNPGLLLIGLDPERNQGLLLRGREAQSLTMDQIREIIGGRR